jgi:hypothetical protein
MAPGKFFCGRKEGEEKNRPDGGRQGEIDG